MSICQLHSGDCREVLRSIESESVDLVVTSPPYADKRDQHYQTVSERDYPEWTVGWMDEVRPTLKLGASVAMVIRPHIRHGQLSDYMLRTRLALRDAGWIEYEELIWHKVCGMPVGRTDYPRRTWESIHWFGVSSHPFVDAKANGQLSDRIGFNSGKGEGQYIHGLGQSDMVAGTARCADVARVALGHNEASIDHPAIYPVPLAEWIIRLLSPPDGTVLDPFMGSGSSAIAAMKQGRNFIGIELEQKYVELAQGRLLELGLRFAA